LSVHHSDKARDRLEAHTDQIEVFFLPSYSPELNPGEYLNCDLWDGVRSGPPARTRKQLYATAFKKTPEDAQSRQAILQISVNIIYNMIV
jgi:hypothetical protein